MTAAIEEGLDEAFINGVERAANPPVLITYPERWPRERVERLWSASKERHGNLFMVPGEVEAPTLRYIGHYDESRGTGKAEVMAREFSIGGGFFTLGIVIGFAAAIVLVMLSGCSREQPIARQSPAKQQPNSSSTDAFTATDEDLDTPSKHEAALRRVEAKTAEAETAASEALKASREAYDSTLAASRRVEALLSHTATDTAQPLRQAETRRVTFAGVAFSDRAIATVVQLSSKPCITVYRIVNNVRTNDVDETFCDPDWAMIRIPNAASAVRFEVIRGARGVHYSRTFHRAAFRDTGQAVTLPVQLGYPPTSERFANVRIIIIGMDANGGEVFMLPETRLVDLPRWVEP